MSRAHVIVLGNEKGGSGKSTTAMHLIVALLRQGWKVGSMDLDARQGTLTRYAAIRSARALTLGTDRLPLPTHVPVHRADTSDLALAAVDERERFEAALDELTATNDYVVIDCPGSDSFLGRVGHAYADTLVTPLNDSFIDLDVLALVDGETMAIQRPGAYSELVWESRKQRAMRDRGTIDWIVMRNRLSALDARNKREMALLLEKLSKRIGFRFAQGFSERVIFRELFLKGLTLLDIAEAEPEAPLSLSQVAARQEVRTLLDMLKLPRREALAPTG
jgi:chromosome partitioning protein